MAGYYRDIIRLLRERGWVHLRTRGSHEVWASADGTRRVVVPADCQKRHTANGILKDAGIDVKL